MPSFPELCCHSMQDLIVLDTREKVSYKVDDEGRRIQQEEVIPTWSGRSMRDRTFAPWNPRGGTPMKPVCSLSPWSSVRRVIRCWVTLSITRACWS